MPPVGHPLLRTSLGMPASAGDTQKGPTAKRIQEQPASREVASFHFQDFSLMRLNAAMPWNQGFPVKTCDHLDILPVLLAGFIPSPPYLPFSWLPLKSAYTHQPPSYTLLKSSWLIFITL